MDLSSVLHRLDKRIEGYRDEMINLQTILTSLPALAPENGGVGEAEKAKCIAGYCRKHGLTDIRNFDAPDPRALGGVRPNLVVSVPGRNRLRSLWIISHMDIVPPGEPEFWKYDPFTAVVTSDRIIGRGTEDNQQDLVASIFAALALRSEKLTPVLELRLAFVADEETGSAKGMVHLANAAGRLFNRDDFIVVPDFGSEDGSSIEIAEKSTLWLRLAVHGKQCHASTPALGVNAMRAASHLVVSLDKLPARFDRQDNIYMPQESTFEPTKREANVPNINTIPGEDVFYLDCRVLPVYDLEEIIGTVREQATEIEHRFGVTVKISTVQKMQAPPPTRETAPVVGALSKAISAVYGVDPKPLGIGGGTVAAHLRQRGLNVAVWSRQAKTAHQPNEFCLIDNMVGNAKVFARLSLLESEKQ